MKRKKIITTDDLHYVKEVPAQNITYRENLPTSIWILTHPRSGSTYLSHLFNNMNLDYNMSERYGPQNCHYIQSPFYPLFNKVMPFQLDYVSNKWKINFSYILKNLKSEQKWIYLKRRDISGRLASYYILIRAGIGHIIQGTTSEIKTIDRLSNMRHLTKDRKKVFNFVKKNQLETNPNTYWDKLIKKHNLDPYVIYYEDFCSDKRYLYALFQYCGFNYPKFSKAIENNKLSITRTVNTELYNAVKADVQWSLDKLRSDLRNQISSGGGTRQTRQI